MISELVGLFEPVLWGFLDVFQAKLFLSKQDLFIPDILILF